MSHGSQTDRWSLDAWAGPQIEHAARECHEAKKLIAALNVRLGRKACIADVCAGDGEKLSSFANVGVLHAFEINEEAVETAKVMYPGIEWHSGDYAQTLPQTVAECGARRFDVVTCLGNSLGTLPGDRGEHVRAMGECGNALFISVFHADPIADVLPKRLEYYFKVWKQHRDTKVKEIKLNLETGTITTELWGDSEAFTEGQLRGYAEDLVPLGFGEPEIGYIEPIGIYLWVQRKQI